MLGDTMTGISLGLDVQTNSLVRERAALEACLALGGTPYQALLPVIRDALRSGFMPISMAAIGLVSLPEIMTDQILAGVEPVDAVNYRLLIMFLIAGGTGLRTLAAVLGGAQLLTDHWHRLRRSHSGREIGRCAIFEAGGASREVTRPQRLSTFVTDPFTLLVAQDR